MSAMDSYLTEKAKIIITLRDEHQLSLIPKRNRVTTVVDLSKARDNQEFIVQSQCYKLVHHLIYQTDVSMYYLASNRNISFCLSFKDSMPVCSFRSYPFLS